MRDDIFEMRKDPAKKTEEAGRLLIGRGAVTNITLDPEPWHSVTITILGDHLHVTLDGQPVGNLKSPGIAHETKQRFHSTLNGPGVFFDDLRIRAVK